MAFLALCPEKSIELGDDAKLHRANKEHIIVRALEAADLGGSERKIVKCLEGGGVAVECNGHDAAIAVEGPFIAAITGSLQNYGYLVKKYLHEELNLPLTVTLEAIKERMPITEAALLCRLYAQLGTTMLSKLRGHFPFVLYDSTTVRVLTARDPSGSVPLVHGHLEDNTLFVSSGTFQPSDAHDVAEIQPGHYKYGWQASARKYSNPESEVKSHAEAASSAAVQALAGLTCGVSPLAGSRWLSHGTIGSGRRSLDSTSRQLKRPSHEPGRVGSRRSLDSSAARHLRQNTETSKTHSRADVEGWWRAKEVENIKTPASSPEAKSPATEEIHKKTRRHRKRHRKAKGLEQAANTKNGVAGESGSDASSEFGSEPKAVEDLISKLPTIFREDSASSRMLTNLLGSSPCSLVVTDATQEDNPIVFVNDQFEISTGYTAQDVLGKNCRFLQGRDGSPCVPSLPSSAIRRALAAGKSVSVKILNYKKDGSPLWNELSIVPLRDAEGRITHHVGMQTFTPALEADRPQRAAAGLGFSTMVRSRSCSDMSALDKVPLQSLENLAF